MPKQENTKKQDCPVVIADLPFEQWDRTRRGELAVESERLDANNASRTVNSITHK